MKHLMLLTLLLSSAWLLSASVPNTSPCFCKCQNDKVRPGLCGLKNKTNDSTFDLAIRIRCINSTKLSDFVLGVTISIGALPTFHYVGCELPAQDFSVGGFDPLRGVENVKFELRGNYVNLTRLPDGFFSDLDDLRIVSLERIGLLNVPQNLLWGSNGIIELNLNSNYVTTLPAKLLRDARLLKKINLSSNDLHILPDHIFCNLTNLVSLDLSWNHLTVISRDLFDGLISLQEINLEHNDLKFIEFDALSALVSLRTAKFSHNQLDLRTVQHNSIGPYSPFYKCNRLEELYLSHNNITEMYADWTVKHLRLRKFDLSYNVINNLQTEDLKFKSDKIQVNLTYNDISFIDLSRLEYIAAKQKSSRHVIVDLNFNPIYCDCDLNSLLRYINGKMNQTALNFVTLQMQQLRCDGPEYLKGTKLLDIEASELECIVEDDVSNFDNSCTPDGICDCRLRSKDKTLFIDCSARNLTVAPLEIVLGIANYVEIDLSNNSLRVGPSLIHNGFEKVRSLDLTGNQIVHVDESLISPNLKILKLNGNNLSYINESVLNKIANDSSISLLTLHDNSWKCDDTYVSLLNFVLNIYERVPDADRINCIPIEDISLERHLNDLSNYHLLIILITLVIVTSIYFAVMLSDYMGWFGDQQDVANQNVPVLDEPLPGSQNV